MARCEHTINRNEQMDMEQGWNFQTRLRVNVVLVEYLHFSFSCSYLKKKISRLILVLVCH